MDCRKLNEILTGLAKKRKVFTGETDFTNSLALEIGNSTGCKILFEVLYKIPVSYHNNLPSPEETNVYVDMLLIEKSGRKTAIEIKYKTARLENYMDEAVGYKFDLRNQSANDVGRYGFRKDIYRLQSLIESKEIDQGFCIFLTSEPNYWNLGIDKGCMDGYYRLKEMVESEDKGWIYESVSNYYKKNKDGKLVSESGKPHWTYQKTNDWKLNLKKEYILDWKNYSNIEYNDKQIEFKYLLLDV